MELPIHILMVYGYAVVFGWVLVEQLGAPLPSTPILLAAGALSAQHQINFWLVLLVGIVACLISDSTWFFIGRRFGHRVVNLLCKFSLQPMVCVRKTENSLGSKRQLTIVFSKFVPGVSTVAAPLAGRSSMSFREFLALDATASLLWMGSMLLCGRLFGDALRRDPSLLNTVGRFSGALLVAGIVGFFLLKLWQRHRTLRRLAATRMDPEDLKSQLDAGNEFYIVDLRHAQELTEDPYTLPGAHRYAPDAVRQWATSVPADADVVVFCSCPGELSAAKTALDLQKFGVEHVRPLKGGYDGWRRLGFPVDAVAGIEPVRLVQLTAVMPLAEPAEDAALSQ